MRNTIVLAALTAVTFPGVGAALAPCDDVLGGKQKSREAVAAARLMGNVMSYAVLSRMEQHAPTACARTLKFLANHSPALEPMLPSVLPLLKSKNAKVRWAVVTFCVATNNQDAASDPLLDLLAREDCMYVVFAALEAFCRWEDKTRLAGSVNVLLDRPLRLRYDPSLKSCTIADGAFYYWPHDFSISETALRNAIADSIALVGPDVLPILQKNLEDQKVDPDCKVVCARAVKQIISFSREHRLSKARVEKISMVFLPLLVAQLDSSDERLQLEAILSIERLAIAVGLRVPRLMQVANDKNRTPRVRASARKAIDFIEGRLSKGLKIS